MICSCKPFILSNLRTFQFLNEIYNLDINLVDNDVCLISDCLMDILLHRNMLPKEVYELRKEKCREAFSKSNAIPWYKVLANTIESSNS